MTQRPTGSWLMYDQILLFLKQEFWNFTFWWESFLTDHWRKSFQGISSFFLASIHPEPSGITQKNPPNTWPKVGPSGRHIDKPTGINFSCRCNPQFTTMVVAAKDFLFCFTHYCPHWIQLPNHQFFNPIHLCQNLLGITNFTTTVHGMLAQPRTSNPTQLKHVWGVLTL